MCVGSGKVAGLLGPARRWMALDGGLLRWNILFLLPWLHSACFMLRIMHRRPILNTKHGVSKFNERIWTSESAIVWNSWKEWFQIFDFDYGLNVSPPKPTRFKSFQVFSWQLDNLLSQFFIFCEFFFSPTKWPTIRLQEKTQKENKELVENGA